MVFKNIYTKMVTQYMRTVKFVCFLLAFVFLPISVNGAKNDHTYGSFKGVHYVKNYDGDTITVNIPGVHSIIGSDMMIRIRGIDTPEMKAGCPAELEKARQAKKMVRSLLKSAKQINLHKAGRGKYFRIIADVEFDGKDLGAILVKNGLAVDGYNGGKKTHDWCAEPESFEKKMLRWVN